MVLKNKKILIVTSNEYEDLELHYPKIRLTEAGAKVLVAGEKENETYTGKHGYPCQSDLSFDQVNVSDYDALVIPGGYSPDKLRTIPRVLEILKEFHHENKLIAFICHAGWLPISAKIIKGIKCTSYETIKDDLVNAGVDWADEAVVVDKNFISSRSPEDLPDFCAAIIDFLSKRVK